MKTIKLEINNETVDKYTKYYFNAHPKARNAPIKQPYHESINKWMIMHRAAMNNIKQRWKDFIIWYINNEGYANLMIDKCKIVQTIYYGNNRRHDPDNSVPKFILDGFVESGFLVDDDNHHIKALTLICEVDEKSPRTEFLIIIGE